MEEFPRLVQMHEKYGKEGLVAMSVSVDPANDDKRMKAVRDFLKKEKAFFSNFVLDEETELWQEKLGTSVMPVVFVFGRNGKLAKRIEEAEEGKHLYDEVEKLLPELLKAR